MEHVKPRYSVYTVVMYYALPQVIKAKGQWSLVVVVSATANYGSFTAAAADRKADTQLYGANPKFMNHFMVF